MKAQTHTSITSAHRTRGAASSRSKQRIFTTLGLALGLVASVDGAGTLSPKGAPDQPIQIRDHHLEVTLNNGFARSEVTQTFFNPNDKDLEAVYRFPLPKSASLSEVTMLLGEREIHGEVVEKEKAKTIYENEKYAGKDAGLATKNGYQSFDFQVHPVRAKSETQLRIVYYQPLEVDTGVGRFVYPLEEGGTDEVASSFWNPVNSKVEGTFSAAFELKSAWPVANIRVPGFEKETVTDKLADGHYKVRVEKKDHSLTGDLVLYYRLADDLPGRVELIPFRKGESGPGTFMMVVTPGLDLKPLSGGADYVFVLDTSGSMQTKLRVLTDGVSRVLGKMQPRDRYRIVTFSTKASDLTQGWKVAEEANVRESLKQIGALQPGGSTNLYDGLTLAMKDLDADRATSVILVTDGVTNTGVVDPVAFHKLTKSHDIRIFGFLLGNSANWPLMRTVCDASGGFYAGVSNADDILGQILQAKSKVLHECLHDAELSITGVKTLNTTGLLPGKIYRGQQLVMFGQYEGSGEAELVLKARMTGEDKVYRTKFRFPEKDEANPELERLWAMDQIEQFELRANTGVLPASESDSAIADLGVKYQLVTDQTSMLVLGDEAFAKQGIERRNQQRVATERSAQAVRVSAPQPVSYRVDSAQQPFTPSPAPSHSGGSGFSLGGGGGALSPLSAVAMALFAALALGVTGRSKKGKA
ncbi:VIT and VWA domain-containing protein [Prosthecobacter sp.]|jgi:Ca-activated chloride channel family protein|uniref:VIT and VWA domain-containing protein n=1 Tax=Prosthecobacter sp. TaxID=1965333 RepID=UPI00378319D8